MDSTSCISMLGPVLNLWTFSTYTHRLQFDLRNEMSLFMWVCFPESESISQYYICSYLHGFSTTSRGMKSGKEAMGTLGSVLSLAVGSRFVDSMCQYTGGL